MSQTTSIDFNSICRSCLTPDAELKSIFNSDPFLDLPRLFTMCADVEISDTDGLPSQMCQQCFVKLISFRDFRNLCRNSNDYLKLYVSKNFSDTGHRFAENDDDMCVEEDPGFWSFKTKNTNVSLSNTDSSSVQKQNNFDENQKKKTKRIKSSTNSEDFKIGDKSLLISTRKRSKFKEVIQKNVSYDVQRVSNFDKKVQKSEFTCNICCENTSSKDELKLHKCLHYSYTCKHCLVRFKNIQFFRAHNCEIIDGDETNSDEKKNESSLEKPKKTQFFKMLKCHLCELEFKNITRLQYHIRSHTGEKPALCTWCGKRFREQRGLINHIRAVHTEEKRFKCSFCPKAFPVSGKRKQHERIHTGEKPYQCDLCNRLFAAKTTLNTHRRIHTGENKFQCKVQGCSRGFYAFSTYQRHMWAHRGERPYSCTECNKTYLSAQNLRSHVKAAHTKLRDEICHICGKGFTEKSVLNRHLRKIHNIEPKDNRPVPIFATPTLNSEKTSDS